MPSSTLTVTVEDNYGGTSAQTPLTETVTAVGPTVTITGVTRTTAANVANSSTTSVPEGSVNRYTFSTTDPGVGDTFSLSVPSTTLTTPSITNPPPSYIIGNVSFNPTTGSGSFEIYFPVPGTVTPPSISVKDANNGLGGLVALPAVTVNYVAPTLTITSSQSSVAAGTTGTGIYTITAVAIDPGYDPLTGWNINWGDTTSTPQPLAASATTAGLPNQDGFPANWGSSTTITHVYYSTAANPGATFNIVGKGTDSTATYTATPSPLAVVVTDPAPTVTFLAAPGSTTEGGLLTYKFQISDPGNDGFTGSNIITYTNPTYGSSQSIYTIVTNLGNDGVNPVNPVSIPYNITYTQGTATSAATETGYFDVTFPNYVASPGSAIVTCQARDAYGVNSNTQTQIVTVAGATPSVTLYSPSGVSTYTPGVTTGGGGGPYLFTFAASDAGINDTFSVVAASGGTDGTVSNLVIGSSAGTTIGSFDVTFSQGGTTTLPVTSTVSIQVQDVTNGLQSAATASASQKTVTVSEVAPSLQISGTPNPVSEGATYTLTLYASDPGVESSAMNWNITWGDGTAVQAVTATAWAWNGNTDQWTTSTTATHSYVQGLGSTGFKNYAISATGSDPSNSGGYGTPNPATTSVTVLAVAPTVAFTYADPTAVNEGRTETYAFTMTDPDTQDTYTVVSVTATTQAGGLGAANGAVSSITPSAGSSNGAGSFSVNFGDGPATSYLYLTLKDNDGSTVTQQLAVAIANVAPAAAWSSPAATATEGSSVTFPFTVSDPGGYATTAPSPGPGPGTIPSTLAGETFSFIGGSLTMGGTSAGPLATVTSQTINAYTGVGSITVFFDHGPQTVTIDVQVQDSNGGVSNELVNTVSVANVAPTPTFTYTPARPRKACPSPARVRRPTREGAMTMATSTTGRSRTATTRRSPRCNRRSSAQRVDDDDGLAVPFTFTPSRRRHLQRPIESHQQ